MQIEDFAEFFESVHGYVPFRWQTRLCEQVHRNRAWPDLIDLPTSSGKTAVLDVSIFLLALEAGLPPGERVSRLRTIFVVDRRLVVDDAEERVKKIAQKLLAPSAPILEEMAARLRSFGVDVPLKHSKMRGGMYRDDTWADRPNQPLVCLSTVDQTGSRLLFRGYQISPSQRPIHAGLLANDARLFLDEAHLSNPFRETLDRIQRRAKNGWSPTLAVTIMTATPPGSDDIRSAFGLEPEVDYSDVVLERRMRAAKPAKLEESKSLASDAVRAARELAKEGDAKRRVVAVVVNRVDTAREIFEGLRDKDQRQAVLLTGRIRPWDREKILREHVPHLKAGSTSTVPYYLVATQTVEVGADLDFDALVTEVAALDSLRQRFGRVNRLGRRSEPSSGIILKRRQQKQDADATYGESLEATWNWLQRNAQDGKVDFGVDALKVLLQGTSGEERLSMAPPGSKEKGPVITEAHWDAWLQTNPSPEPDPDVAPFLHGKSALENTDVSVVWRVDLAVDEETGEAAGGWVDRVVIAPPSSMEALPVPIWAVRRWLGVESGASAVTDVEGSISSAAGPETGTVLRPFLVWQGPDDSTVARVGLRPGTVLVVPANYGGCDEWGWNPDSRLPVRDIGNEVALDSTGRRILRLLPELLEVTPKNLEGAEEDASPRELLENFRRSIDAEREVDRDSREEAELALRKGIAQQYGPDRGFESPSWRFSIEANLGTVLLTNAETRKGQRTPPSTEVQSKEDQSNEDDGASLGQRLVSLKDHVDGVVEQTKELADGCGLPGDIRSDLVLAAKLHDLGKADERFQALLRLASESALAEEAFASGDPSDKPELLLAKSGGPPISGRRFKRIQRLSGYPSRCRHEFLSLALADECPLLAGAHDANLVRHLIGTHHGFGRALAPWWLEDEPIPVSVEVEEAGKVSIDSSAARRFALLDSEWPDQYWRLVERYGAWGLAYLESILRRADCLRSAWESEHGANAARG